jgi:hypothetical protein
VTRVLELAQQHDPDMVQGFASRLTQNGLEIDEESGELYSPGEEELTEAIDHMQAATDLRDEEINDVLNDVLERAVHNGGDVEAALEDFVADGGAAEDDDDVGYYDDDEGYFARSRK